MKLIIADDEKWVRVTARSMIPFEKLGLVLSCEAANGIEALELCRQHKPDILITDIMMPGLTGLELIRELHSCLPELRIIIISGYNDFEYARTAMKYGITDYLLKPIDGDELVQVLERIISEIGESARLKLEKAAGEEIYKKALPVISEAFMNRIISCNNMTSDSIRNELLKYGIKFSCNSYTICVISPDEGPHDSLNPERYNYYITLIKRIMRRYTKAITFPLLKEKNTQVSIISSNNADISLQKAFDLCNRLLWKKLNLRVSAGVSYSTHQLCMLQDLYEKACDALESRFWSKGGTLSLYSPGQLVREIKVELSEDMLNKITLDFKLSNIKTALTYLDDTSAAFYRECNIYPSYVREFYWQFLQSVIIMLNFQVPYIHHEEIITGEVPYEKIKRCQFMHTLKDYISEQLNRIYNFYHDKIIPDSGNIIENAKKLINSNFAGDLSLEQVARYVHLSPAYLSELFKKETGMSFIDYKTLLRIEYAKKLLTNPSLNVCQISEKTGYSDPKYFSKLFKKITGKTIYEYRKESRPR